MVDNNDVPDTWEPDCDLENRPDDVWERDGQRVVVRRVLWTTIGTYLDFGYPLNSRAVHTMEKDGWKRMARGRR